MKKGLKITLISLAAIVGILLITVCIALCTVFSSKRLTKIVNKEAPNFITCDFKLKKVDLTFFKTFPNVGLDIHELTLLNRMYGAPTDTLLHVKHCTAAINIREFLNNNNIIVKNFNLQDGNANLYINSIGQNNYSVFKTDTTKEKTEFNYDVDLQKVTTENVNVRYTNLQSKMRANVNDIDLVVKGNMLDDDIHGKVKINTKDFDFKTLDSNRTHLNYDKLKFSFDGDLAQMDKLGGDMELNIDQFSMSSDTNKYLESINLCLKSTIDLILSLQKANLQDTKLSIGDYNLTLDGTAQRNIQDGDIRLDLNYTTEKWPLKEVLALLPQAIIGNILNGMDLDGKIGLSGKVKGHYNDHQMPIVTADVNWSNGTFAMKDFPLTFQKINTLFNICLDLKNQTDVAVKSLDCYTGNNHLTAKGTIKDLLGKMLFDVSLTGDLHVPDFKQFLPDAFTRCNAEAKAVVDAQFDWEQLSNLMWNQMSAKGNIVFTNLDLAYQDSLFVQSPSATVDIRFPVTEHPYNIGEWAAVSVKADKLTGNKIGLGELTAEGTLVDGYVNDITDSTLEMKLGADYDFESLTAEMDTISAFLSRPSGTFVMQNSEKLSLKYTGEMLAAKVGKQLAAQTGTLALTASTNYNEKESNALMRWNPDVKINLKKGNVNINGLDVPVEIPQLQADFTVKKGDIQKGDIKLGRSDFSITGKITDMDKYFRGEDLLTGNLELSSNYIDINQIMDLISGFGAPDSVMAEKPKDSESDPFMVPYGMNIRMHTNIKRALFEDAEIRNVGGYISLKDGVLVLDEMGLTSDAAHLQLTALYKSPRKNHLFLGLDFHLLDIQIDKLIAMIPEVDTILPMLKSFAGNAEFHFAIETYLKSNYNLKYSTLRGAAAINGQDLVVLDQETYDKISKLLRFKKGTTNKIDSLSAELTIFKNEIDVYPFAVSIDKYQAILSGRHNLDMSYNYNISLLKPIKLGLDIIGTDKLRFNVGKPKYANMFRPERQNVVEQNVMQLKTQINNALKANVKPQSVE